MIKYSFVLKSNCVCACLCVLKAVQEQYTTLQHIINPKPYVNEFLLVFFV